LGRWGNPFSKGFLPRKGFFQEAFFCPATIYLEISRNQRPENGGFDVKKGSGHFECIDMLRLWPRLSEVKRFFSEAIENLLYDLQQPS
jgi:hypothetical protein